MKIPKFYRNFAFLFLAGGVLSFFAFFYFILGKATIYIQASFTEVPISSVVDIKEPLFEVVAPDDENVAGKIFELTLDDSKRYEATGKKDIVSDVVGRVTIINNYSKDQTLIATTRLLSPDGVLLRMKEGVLIKPGERIDVSVYPDLPQTFSRLGPTRFTIPGLWGPLQEYIYAQSSTELRSGGYQVTVVSEEDLAKAEQDLTRQMEQKATSEFQKQLSGDASLYSRLIQKEVIRKESDALAGDEKDFFQIAISMRVVMIAFDERELVQLVKKKIREQLPSGKVIHNFDGDALNYVVEKYDIENNVAHMKVSGAAQAIIEVDNKILEKSLLTGMSAAEVSQWLLQYPEIKDVRLEFSPAWLKRTPRFAHRIDIVME